MTDDPREILKQAGVDVPEVEAYFDWDSDSDSSGPFVHEMADPVILSLSRLVVEWKEAARLWREDKTEEEKRLESELDRANGLVAKYKWQRDDLLRSALEEHGFDPDDDVESVFEGELADLDRNWAEREAEND